MVAIIPNLTGTNAKYNSIVSKIESTKKDALSKMETTAAIATSSLLSNLTGLTSELRALIPTDLPLPNINLQAELTSLAGLTDVVQSSELLTAIKNDFEEAVTAAGYNIDTLVSEVEGAIAEGKSIANLVPNFEKDAAGLFGAFQKATNLKLPAADSISEFAATFISNTYFAAAKTEVESQVDSFSTIGLPTANTDIFKLATETKNITQSFKGLSITKTMTTPLEAFMNDTLTRANISSDGFSNRPIEITESFTDASNVVLAHDPVRIISVMGRTSTTEKIRGKDVSRFQLNPQGIGRVGKLYRPDTYALSGKTVSIDQTVRQYDNSTWAIRVTYRYNDTYDPTYVI